MCGRELEHTIQRAVVLCPESQIEVGDITLYGPQIEGTAQDLERRTFDQDPGVVVVSLDEFERRYILGVLEATNYQIKGTSGAARLLKLPPSTLYSKMKRLGIKNEKS